MKYVMNSAIITAPGLYHYRLISPDEAKEWLLSNTFESTVGYPETAEALRQLTGVTVPVRKVSVHMAPEDEALVFRLTVRVPSELKGNLGVDWILKNSEIGLLRRLC